MNRFMFVVVPFILIFLIYGLQRLIQYRLFFALLIVTNLACYSTLTLLGKTGSFNVLRDVRAELDKYS